MKKTEDYRKAQEKLLKEVCPTSNGRYYWKQDVLNVMSKMDQQTTTLRTELEQKDERIKELEKLSAIQDQLIENLKQQLNGKL